MDSESRKFLSTSKCSVCRMSLYSDINLMLHRFSQAALIFHEQLVVKILICYPIFESFVLYISTRYHVLQCCYLFSNNNSHLL